MKTIYLLMWFINAIVVTILSTNTSLIIVSIFNIIIPFVFLLIRMLFIHGQIDESKIIL